MVRGLLPELRHVARVLMKSRGFTFLAATTLALGITANAAVFSGINAVLFRELPATSDPERLRHIRIKNRSATYVEYEALQASSHVLEGLSAYRGPAEAEWRFDGRAVTLVGEYVSGNYFDVLGVRLAHGRALTIADERAAADNVVVVSDDLRRRYWAAEPDVLGKHVRINDRSFTIIGVAPAAFKGPEQPFAPQWWIAARTEISARIGENSMDFALIGRLKRGVSAPQAEAELAGIVLGFNRPEAQSGRAVSLESVRGFQIPASERGSYYRVMAAAVTVVGLMLLVTSANIATFLLVRTTARRREIALRLALGASRAQIARLLLLESAYLAALGGGTAVILTFWASDLLSYGLSLAQEGLRWNAAYRNWDLTPDWRVFAMTFVLSGLVSLACGLTPAMQGAKADLMTELKEGSGSGGVGFRSLAWRDTLVAVQVACTLVLVVGSGLFLRSAQQAARADLGLTERQLAFTRIDLPRKPTAAMKDARLYRALQRRAAALPLVESASLADVGLLEGTGFRSRYRIQVSDSEPSPLSERVVGSVVIGSGYFATLGVPLELGRDFVATELAGSSRVVIVNEALARLACGEQDPIGRPLRLFSLGSRESELVEIVGVAKDVAHDVLEEPHEPILYRPADERFFAETSRVVLLARARHDPGEILPPIAALMKDLSGDVQLTQSTLVANLGRQILPTKTAAAFFALFGALGAFLAALALAGVLAHSVARRTKEIGVRMALGADHGNVLRTVLREGTVLTLVGVAGGVLLSLVASPVLDRFLYGISGPDLLTYVVSVALVVLIAMIACVVPARRAARMDPLAALRHE